jgi:ADP-ribose pyrophosphatase YjhB (NUDIX family)/transcriptional regulator with XRE-family HTH domain
MPESTNPFVGLVLRRARRDAGLSQRALATRAGVPASTVAAAESAQRDLKVATFAALLDAGGWSLRVVDRDGNAIDELPVFDGPLDAADRRYPAHVELRSTERLGSWWGDRWGPYWGRPPRPPRTFDLPRRQYAGAMTRSGQVLRVAVYGVVEDSAGRVLLARLSDQTAEPGWWTLPGGGLDHGEHPEAAVVREVAEETGLAVRVESLLGVDSQHVIGASGADLHSIRIVYRAYAEDERSPLVHEVGGSTDEARWVPPDEIEKLALVDLVRFGLKRLAS